MDEARKKYGGWVFGFYFGGVSAILKIILLDGFSLSAPLAGSISILITTLAGYPILVRFVEPRRSFLNRSGKMWTRPQYIVLSIVMSVAFYLIATYFRWR